MQIHNAVLCDSLRIATDTLASRPEWRRVAADRWNFEGEEYRVFIGPNNLRGYRLDKIVVLPPTSRDLIQMACERKART